MDRTKLTFSQAEGLESVPSPLALGELSQQLRVLIWALIYESLQQCRHVTSGICVSVYIRDPWASILRYLHLHIDHKPIDEFDNSYDHHENKIKNMILTAPHNKVFDFLQHVLRHSKCPWRLLDSLQWAFRKGQAAYEIIENTIVPRALKEEGAALQEAFVELKVDQFSGARKHLIAAAESLTKGNFSDSVRESIHAVESVAKVISGDHSASFRGALDLISKKIPIHGAFKGGLVNLYGYTSDEKGIRHPLLDEPSKVDSADAQFMLGACASFISYLINKARAGELI